MKYKKRLIFLCLISLIIFLLTLLNFPSFLSNLDVNTNSYLKIIQTDFTIKLSAFMGIIFSSTILIIVTFILGTYHWLKKEKKDALFSAFTILLGATTVFVLKEIINRERPFNILINETGFSFPSGHATMSLIFFGIITYLIFKKAKSKKTKIITSIIASLAILSISLSRLILNAHWFTDIIAGLSLGTFILSLCILFRKIID